MGFVLGEVALQKRKKKRSEIGLLRCFEFSDNCYFFLESL